MDVQNLWSLALQEALETDLKKIVADGVSLSDLQRLRDAEVDEFAALVSRKDLASLGLPTKKKHRSTITNLIAAIYKRAPAIDVLAQSHAVLSITWSITRLLLQIATDYYDLSERAARILKRVLNYVEIWTQEASLYKHDSHVKSSIQTLFHKFVVLVGVARHISQQPRWKKFARTLSGSNTLEPFVQNLLDSVDSVDRNLRCAAGTGAEAFMPTQYEHRNQSNQHWRDNAQNLHQIHQEQQETRREIRQIGMNMTILLSTCMKSVGGETRSCCWYTPNYKLERSDIFLVPETCRWLFDLSKWVCWQRGSKPQLLLINGAPGTGKTSLAFSSLTKLRAEATRPVLSHLFNSASGPTANAGSKLLANIIVQLYASACGTSKEAIFEAIKSEQALHSTVWECSFATLQQLVKRVLETYPSYVLVVDALDECTADHRELCQFLEELALNKGAAIMATCRGPAYFNYHDHDVVELQSRTEEIGADLARFVEYEVDKKLELKADALAELRNHVINEVIARSQNNFLHAKLLVGFLEQQSTPRQTRETIDSIRYDYCSDLYEKHLNASNERLSNYPSKMVRRQCIFQMLVAAQETLSVDQISEFLALNDKTGDQDEQDLSYNITKEIKELCEPFVCFLGSRKVAFFHTSAKEFFACRSPTTLDESNLYLARKCLSTLSQDQYRKPEAVTKLLRRHLGAESTKSDTLEKPSMSSIYEYAALYFHQHVTAVQDPPSELVLKLNRFLMGVEFVMWSETIFDLKPGTSYAGQITVRVALSKWTENLSPPNQQDIQLDHYFEKAHILVYMILKDTNDDKILQFLPRIRLGDYYNSTGRELDDWEKGHDEKQIVVDGLSSVLPENDPFLLRQKVNLVLDYLWQKRYSELLPQVKALYDLQMKVAPKEDTYLTAWLFGASLIGLGLYNEAESIIVETLERVREFYGEEYRFFNILLLLEGQRLERVQDLQKAAASYRAALKTVTRTAGPQNILVLVLKTALGSVLRKQGAYDLAEPNLFEGWAGRQIVSSIDLSVCLDAALQLAMLYRDRGDSSECLKLLDTVHRSKVFAQDFERYCQLIHIRNLVAFDNGDYLIAKYSLLELLQSASGENRSKNNLELLWVRIDLADAMRQQNEHDEALMLFTDLVEAIDTTDIDSEPEPPSQLAVAERALRLVRKAEFEKSKNLLEKNNLRWVREADFWFSLTGGPTLDTSMIRPVKF